MRAACPTHFILLRTFRNQQPATHEAPAVPQTAAAPQNITTTTTTTTMLAQTPLLQELGRRNDIFPASRIFLINLLHVEPYRKQEQHSGGGEGRR